MEIAANLRSDLVHSTERNGAGPKEPAMAIPMVRDRSQCPTCRAPRTTHPVCHRCKTDLSFVLEIEDRADQLRAAARTCYARGWYRRATSLAEQVVALEPRPEDLRLLACAALFSGDFPAALNTARHALRSDAH